MFLPISQHSSIHVSVVLKDIIIIYNFMLMKIIIIIAFIAFYRAVTALMCSFSDAHYRCKDENGVPSDHWSIPSNTERYLM